MGTAVRTATTSPASWDAFADVDAFVDEVLTELAADLPPVWRTPKAVQFSRWNDPDRAKRVLLRLDERRKSLAV
jgi:hypothetical protein